MEYIALSALGIYVYDRFLGKRSEKPIPPPPPSMAVKEEEEEEEEEGEGEKEGYQELNTIGVFERSYPVSDEVFLAKNELLGNYMRPNFKKEPHYARAHEWDSKLNLYTGNVKKMYDRPEKKENPPIYAPFKYWYLPNKNDIMNQVDGMADRFRNETGERAKMFEKPTEPIRVPPGVGLGYNTVATDKPFHQNYRVDEKTIDELKGKVRPTYQLERTNPGSRATYSLLTPADTRKQNQAVYGQDVDEYLPSLGTIFQAPKRDPNLILADTNKGRAVLAEEEGNNLYGDSFVRGPVEGFSNREDKIAKKNIIYPMEEPAAVYVPTGQRVDDSNILLSAGKTVATDNNGRKAPEFSTTHEARGITQDTSGVRKIQSYFEKLKRDYIDGLTQDGSGRMNKNAIEATWKDPKDYEYIGDLKPGQNFQPQLEKMYINDRGQYVEYKQSKRGQWVEVIRGPAPVDVTIGAGKVRDNVQLLKVPSEYNLMDAAEGAGFEYDDHGVGGYNLSEKVLRKGKRINAVSEDRINQGGMSGSVQVRSKLMRKVNQKPALDLRKRRLYGLGPQQIIRNDTTPYWLQHTQSRRFAKNPGPNPLNGTPINYINRAPAATNVTEPKGFTIVNNRNVNFIPPILKTK